MAIQAQFLSENLGFSQGNSQDLWVDIDNLLFATSQHHHHQQLNQFQNHLQQKDVPFHQLQSVAFSQSVSDHIDRERMEFEHFIRLQNERLRVSIQEERKHQIAILAKKYEWKTEFLLRQKEEQIRRATNRNMELQNFMKKMEIENQTWQTMARENEAMIASLNSSIQRLRETADFGENVADDAESCCQNLEEIDGSMKMICRCCNSRNSCVVMLPCRHLCSCKDCEVFLESCPVCSMAKKATIEALI